MVGQLYIVATPIGNLQDITPRALDVLGSVSLIAAEDTRHSGKLLRAFNIQTPMISHHQHNEQSRVDALLAALDEGDVALVSDAGTPAVSDPGAILVRAALEAGHRVVPVPGASAVIAAVSASGIVDGPFLFQGFLPRSGQERRVALGRIQQANVPVVMFESPRRLVATLSELAAFLGERQAVVARELTKLHEEIRMGTLASLASHFGQEEVRGEIVIVMGTAGTQSDDLDEEGTHRQLARTLLADGLKPSMAARELARITGISGAEAYDVVRHARQEE